MQAGARRDPAQRAIRELGYIMGCYGRHFAGQPRATRDLRMLDELIERLADVHARMSALADGAQRARAADRLRELDHQRALLAGERDRIRAARDAGTPAERAAFLAMRADAQRALYRVHLAGQPRLSRRPGLLRRIIANLEDIQAEPRDPVRPVTVGEDLAAMRRELDLVELEHQGASTAERIASLGAAANQIIREYDLYFAGQDRVTRDLERMGHICDRMAEIEQQMSALARRYHGEALTHSLDVVQLCLARYEQEHELIRHAQTK